MPKYMITASYTPEGARGLQKGGGTARRAAVKRMLEAAGGKLESFYFAYGENDVFAVVDVPDAATALAASVTINSSGAVHMRAVPLVTVEEMDAACKKAIAYTPPGK